MLSALVLTYNGERLLRECINSLDFCDYILIVDSYSTDSTIEIVRTLGEEEKFKGKIEFIQNKWTGPGPQFEFAFQHLKSDWVFSLDQDELCSEDLRSSVLKVMQSGSEQAGYLISRCSWYYDRFMRHSGWYPDYLLRLFNVKKMQVKVSGAHYSFHPVGTTIKLSGDIIHYPYASFAQHLDKINDYAQKAASEMTINKKKGGLLKGILHGLGRFLRLYILKLGFLDGRAGFINAVHGCMYAFLKYVRVNEGSWGKPFNRLK